MILHIGYNNINITLCNGSYMKNYVLHSKNNFILYTFLKNLVHLRILNKIN